MTGERGPLMREGASCPAALPRGLRRMPEGVDELATEHLVVDMGPQHPHTDGALHVLLELDGEEIVAAEASLGYLHRGIEKLSENRRYHQIATLMDRADHFSGIHTELAYALAVERLAGIEVPRKAHWIRALMSEVNRISSHLLWMGSFGMDAGAMAPFSYALRDRETLLDFFEAETGARMMFNHIRPGGVQADLTPAAEPALREFLGDFEKHLEEYHDLLSGNEIFIARVRDVGVIEADTALSFSMTGPSLRGAGIGWDVRKEFPYAVYDRLEFGIPVGERGDCWDRYMVRMEEMRVSAELVRDLLDGMPGGEVMARVPRVLRPPAGESYAAVESPRGELGVHLYSDGGDRPYRLKLRAPSLFNLSVVDEVLPGHKMADSVVIIGSLDIAPGEIDR